MNGVQTRSAVTPRIVCCGEAMVELAFKDGNWALGYAGDTLNTAIHLARAGHSVSYLSALGPDPFSAGLRGAMQAEGVDDSLVITHPTRSVGLYAITTDPRGERSFTYWRDASAARAMFELDAIDAAMREAEWAGLFSFSLISLAILPPEGRQHLLDLAGLVRANGGRVAFDGNYRPRLWESPATAIVIRDAAIALADIGLPTLEDETALSGETGAAAVAAHWQSLGCAEVIVKLGIHGCRLPDGTIRPPAQILQPVDTSGAGDAFNAGYLGGRLAGHSIEVSACAGHNLAGWTIMRPGAIPPRDS